MRPFFTYFGGKWRIAKHYPLPQRRELIEPFAGSAGYALHYPEHRVRLYDLDPVIFGVWDYLIKTSSKEILSLPLEVESIDTLHVCQEAKWLIGFNLNHGTTRPGKTPNSWMRAGKHDTSFWGEAWRARVAAQVEQIKHWTIENKSYADIENQDATWFIDPPYHKSGEFYKYSSSKIDYVHLGAWCQARRGQVIVCEQDGAIWLPFKPFMEIKTMEGSRAKVRGLEVIWVQGTQSQQTEIEY